MSSDRAISSELDRLAALSFEDVAQEFGGLDNPDLYRGGELPVDIIRFVEDELYLGSILHADPRVLELLWLIESEGVREAFVEVGKGSGKSFIGAIVPTYGIYKVLMMHRPHLYFRITDDTTIVALNVSVGQKQAKNVIFQQMSGLVTKCPWFLKHAPCAPLTEEVQFPNRGVALFCGHSNSSAFLGFATLRAVLDETNFMFNTANRNVAEELFTAIRGSCKTRYPSDYKIVAISSAGAPNAWLHTEVENIRRAGREVPLSPAGIRLEAPQRVASELPDVDQVLAKDDLFAED